MNIITSNLITGLSAIYTQSKINHYNMMSLFMKISTTKNTDNSIPKNMTSNKGHKKHSDIAPAISVKENYFGLSTKNGDSTPILEMTRHSDLLSEPHNDLVKLLAQPLNDFKLLSPAEAYNKWMIPAKKQALKTEAVLVPSRPAPPPPVRRQSQPAVTHRQQSVASETKTRLVSTIATVKQAPRNTERAILPEQLHPLITRAKSEPAAQPLSFLSELNSALAARNSAANIEQKIDEPTINTKKVTQPQRPYPLIMRAQSEPAARPLSFLSELNSALAARKSATDIKQKMDEPTINAKKVTQPQRSHPLIMRAKSEPAAQPLDFLSELNSVLAARKSATDIEQKTEEQKDSPAMAVPNKRDPLLYVREFKEVF